MAVRIRLRRTGKRNAPCHRIVVADARSPRDGRFIENIGTYDPRHKTEQIDLERVDYWLSNGAQPSETVGAIIKRARAGVSLGAKKQTEDEAAPIAAEQEAAPETAAEDTDSAEADAAEADSQE